MQKPVITFEGTGWNNDSTTEMFIKDEYTFFVIKNRDGYKEIKFRNVGSKNEESAIQFEIEEYKNKTNRRRQINFSIPLVMAEIFIERIGIEKEHPNQKSFTF